MPTPADLRRIQQRAYQIWEQEGRPEGRAAEHWRQAEQQLEVEFRVGFPDATGDEDPESALSASDSEGAAADRRRASGAARTTPGSTRAGSAQKPKH
jgi:hypothetical protein